MWSSTPIAYHFILGVESPYLLLYLEMMDKVNVVFCFRLFRSNTPLMRDPWRCSSLHRCHVRQPWLTTSIIMSEEMCHKRTIGYQKGLGSTSFVRILSPLRFFQCIWFQITSRIIDHRITDPLSFQFRDGNRSKCTLHALSADGGHPPSLARTDSGRHSTLYLWLHTEHLRLERRYCTCCWSMWADRSPACS